MLSKLCAYNNWANSLLLHALTDASSSNSASIPDYSMSLMSHIANAQAIWSCRILDLLPNVSVWELHDLETCKEMFLQTGQSLKEIVNHNTSTNRVITYRTFGGESFETAIDDILLHVFNHGTYHRAQIARDLKNNGIPSVNTDYIQFVRHNYPGLDS